MSVLEGIREGLADLTRQDFPTLNAPPGPHSYRVVAVRDDGRCDLRAVKDGPPREIANVDHWAGAGAASKPRLGSIVVVNFLDGDPNAPMIGTYQPLRVDGGIPTQSTLDADILRLGPSADLVQLAVGPMTIASPVARVGDAVSLGSLSGVAGSGPGAMAVTFTLAGGTPGLSVSLVGTIIEGSAKVTAG